MKKTVLCLALVAGTFAIAQQKQKHPRMDPAQRHAIVEKKREAKLDNMQKELNLSEDQVAKIRIIQTDRQQQREQARAEQFKMRSKRLETSKKERQQMDDEMRKVLTPEQYEKWEANKQSRMPHKKPMKKHPKRLVNK